MERLVIITTTSDDQSELERIAEHLVGQRLAACAQVGAPIKSLYRWQGQVESAQEWTLTIKTTADLARRVGAEVERLHHYEVPEILASEPQWVAIPYHKWAIDQVAPAAPLASWHLFLHGVAALPQHLPDVLYAGKWPILDIAPTMLGEPMPIEFEPFCQRLRDELDAHCEPDGAFGWHPPMASGQSGDGREAWRTSITGTIHCLDERVMGLEVFGSWREEDWHRLRGLFQEVPEIVVQIVEAGVFVSSATFAKMIADLGHLPSR